MTLNALNEAALIRALAHAIENPTAYEKAAFRKGYRAGLAAKADAQPTPAAGGAGELPPLPGQAFWGLNMHGSIVIGCNNHEKQIGMSPGASEPMFTSEQMHAYARAALSAASTAPDEPTTGGARNPLNELRETLCAVGIVGEIDGHAVIRRDSVIELIDRRCPR